MRTWLVVIVAVLGGCGSAPVTTAATQRASPSFHDATTGEERSMAGVAVCWCPPGCFVMGSPV
ncbi:MAG: hypothetical protein ABIP94_09480, partial [Planctomycetota bacterium]